MVPSDSGGDKPPSIPQPDRRTRVLTSRPIEPAEQPPQKGAWEDFQKKVPPASTESATVAEAIKTIKPEDAFEVHKTVCGRQGFMTSLGMGTASGLLRFIWRGAPKTAANWAVGGGLLGAVVGFEYCHYLRRLERRSMQRIVEVHSAATKEKADRVAQEAQEKKRLEEAARKRWWKPW